MDGDAAAYVAIERLHRAYADIATRRAWNEVPSIATEDARFCFTRSTGGVFEVEGAVAFGEFGAQNLGRFTFHLFIPLNFVVSIGTDGSARGRSYMLEVGEERDTGEWVEAYGIYSDEYACVEGSWLFSRRDYRAYGVRSGGRLQAFPLQFEPQ